MLTRLLLRRGSHDRTEREEDPEDLSRGRSRRINVKILIDQV